MVGTFNFGSWHGHWFHTVDAWLWINYDGSSVQPHWIHGLFTEIIVCLWPHDWGEWNVIMSWFTHGCEPFFNQNRLLQGEAKTNHFRLHVWNCSCVDLKEILYIILHHLGRLRGLTTDQRLQDFFHSHYVLFGFHIARFLNIKHSGWNY